MEKKEDFKLIIWNIFWMKLKKLWLNREKLTMNMFLQISKYNFNLIVYPL